MTPAPIFSRAIVLLLPVGLLVLMLDFAASGHSASVVAILICLVCAIPILLAGRRRLDFFAPWNYMFYYVVLNVLLRSIFIDFEIGVNITDIDGIFYLGK